MKNRNYLLIIADIIIAFVALYTSFLLRFDLQFPKQYTTIFFQWIPFFSISHVMVFYFSGLYVRIWKYTSLFDLYAILRSIITACGLSFIFVIIKTGALEYPRSVLLLYFLTDSLLVVASRLSVRIYYSHYHKDSIFKNSDSKKILLLIGAGKTGEKIAREIRSTSRHRYSLAGFVDDNPEKHGALLHGKKIYGSTKDLHVLNIKYDELLITAPSATGDQMRRLVKSCKKTGKRYRTVPGYQS